MESSREGIIKKLLLAPIKVNRSATSIAKQNIGNYEEAETYACIVSPQKYCRTLDPDMSDFAVGFYECVYANLLEHDILDGSYLRDKERFAGDTMNSFNTPANALGYIGKASDREKGGAYFNRLEWPSYVRTYYQRYHCLANFWLLPMKLGRQSAKGGSQDYMHRFLDDVVDGYSNRTSRGTNLIAKYDSYFKAFGSLEQFIETHAIDCYFDPSGCVIKPPETDDFQMIPKEFIKTYAVNMMCKRADLLVARYGVGLWEYFKSLGLTEESQVDDLPEFPKPPLGD